MTPQAESPQPETATPVASAEDAEEPVLRVTAETTPSPSRSSKQKDEKKAAAGRAGAAARKAKTERLERELAEAKEALRDPAFVADPPDAEAAPLRRSDEKEEEDSSMFPWPVGVLVAAAGALAYLSQFHRAEPRPPQEKKPLALQNSAGSAQQLKVAHNPHYME